MSSRWSARKASCSFPRFPNSSSRSTWKRDAWWWTFMSEGPLLHVELVTLFPELFDSILGASLLGKAVETGLVAVDRTNPREFGIGKHRSVDDSPYGGGPGMVMRPEPIAAAIDDIEAKRGRTHRVFLSPSGQVFDQALAV